MKNLKYIIVLLVCFAQLFSVAQDRKNTQRFVLKGKVLEKETRAPIPGVSVVTSLGDYEVTNGLGEFNVNVRIGEEIIVEDEDMETVTYMVKSKEDVLILVEGYNNSDDFSKVRSFNDITLRHQALLDSAENYRKIDIQRSTDFVARSISLLGKRGRKKERARSLSKLGEIYMHHGQFDLAIDSFEDALKTNKTIATSLLLGRVNNVISNHM